MDFFLFVDALSVLHYLQSSLVTFVDIVHALSEGECPQICLENILMEIATQCMAWFIILLIHIIVSLFVQSSDS